MNFDKLKQDTSTPDPIVEGLEALGTEFEKVDKRVEDKLKATEKKVDEKLAYLDKQVEELKTSQEAGFATTVDKLNSIEKRATAVGRLVAGDATEGSRLLDLIPTQSRSLIYHCERMIDGEKRAGMSRGRMHVPEFAALTEHWFKQATKLQLRGYAGQAHRLKEECDKIASALEDIYRVQKAAYDTTADNGGELIPTIVQTEILRLIYDSSVFAAVARHIPMTTNTMNIPNEAAAFTVYWSSEAATLTGGENTFSTNILSAKKIIGRATASQEVVDDSIVGLLPYLQTVIAEQIGYKIDSEVSDGTGTNFTGLVTASGVNSVATTTTDGEAIVYSDLVRAYFKAGHKSTRVNSAWFMAPAMFSSIIGLTDSNGQPIFHIAGAPNAPEGTILGRPVHLSKAMSVAITRGATGGTGNVYFGDPQKLIFGDRMGLRWEVTDQVNWAKDQIDCRMIGRFGFTVAVPAAWTKIVGGVAAT